MRKSLIGLVAQNMGPGVLLGDGDRLIVRRVIDERLLEERKYLMAFFRKELDELREMIAKLDTREDNDAMASVEEIVEVNKRLTSLEEQFAKFEATHA